MNVIVSNKCQAMLANLNIDVIKNLNGVFSVEDIGTQFRNFYYNKMILDITAIENYEDVNTVQELSVALDMSKVVLLLDDSPRVNSPIYLSQLVSVGIYNFTKDINAVVYLMDNPNTYKDVASFHQLNITAEEIKLNDKKVNKSVGFIGQRIIGVKNLTDHAGSTTLTYLLKKHIEKFYRVKAVEIEKRDFVFFNDDNLDSVNNFDLKKYINKNDDAEVILVDCADSDVEDYCTDIVYLIEPGLIQLNRLIRQDNRVFDKLRGKKLVLNRSILSNSDINDFERESGSKIFFNIPCVDDKLDNIKELKAFLIALGFTRFSDDGDSKLFGIF